MLPVVRFVTLISMVLLTVDLAGAAHRHGSRKQYIYPDKYLSPQNGKEVTARDDPVQEDLKAVKARVNEYTQYGEIQQKADEELANKYGDSLKTVYWVIEGKADELLQGTSIIGETDQAITGRSEYFKHPLFRVSLDPTTSIIHYANDKASRGAPIHGDKDLQGKMYSLVQIDVGCFKKHNEYPVGVYQWFKTKNYHLTFDPEFIRNKFSDVAGYPPLLLHKDCYSYINFDASVIRQNIVSQQIYNLVEQSLFFRSLPQQPVPDSGSTTIPQQPQNYDAFAARMQQPQRILQQQRNDQGPRSSPPDGGSSSISAPQQPQNYDARMQVGHPDPTNPQPQTRFSQTQQLHDTRHMPAYPGQTIPQPQHTTAHSQPIQPDTFDQHRRQAYPGQTIPQPQHTASHSQPGQPDRFDQDRVDRSRPTYPGQAIPQPQRPDSHSQPAQPVRFDQDRRQSYPDPQPQHTGQHGTYPGQFDRRVHQQTDHSYTQPVYIDPAQRIPQPQPKSSQSNQGGYTAFPGVPMPGRSARSRRLFKN